MESVGARLLRGSRIVLLRLAMEVSVAAGG